MTKFEQFPLQEVGKTCHLVGGVWEHEGTLYLLKFPGVADKDFGTYETFKGTYFHTEVEEVGPTVEEWQQLLRQADTVETEVLSKDEDGKLYKAVVRKAEHQVNKNVSWRVFKRDGYACRYCGNDSVPLTVDHLVLWEDGGPDTEQNLVAACKQCNKARGNMKYGDWLNSFDYVKLSKRLTKEQRGANKALLATLADIPLKIKKRKRK